MRGIHHVAVFTADWSPAHLHHFALQTADLAQFVTVRDRLRARGACDERVIDFGEGPFRGATRPGLP